jgi:hypothetical protein
MPDLDYSMVQECANRYEARRQADGSLEIHISVPRRFADLWLTKLSELRTTDAEITEYESDAR